MSTFSKQSELPPLPVPPLNETLDKYLKCARALATPEEYDNTVSLVKEFRESGLASQLQEALLNRAKEKENWIEDWWYDVYNEVREPIAPYLSLASVNSYYTPVPGAQISRAADITHYWMRFWEKIRDETLPITRSRGVVWDMHQFHCLFNSTRVPALPKDRLDRYFKTVTEGPCPSHIAVFCKGNIWKVDMVRNGQLISPDEIYQIFSYIANQSNPTDYSILSMTSEHRDTWAKVRQSIIDFSPINKESISVVDKAVFCVSFAEESISDVNRLLEAGMMGQPNYVWMDKCVNLVIYQDGQMTLQADHSNVDAIVVLQAGDYAAAKVRKELWEPETSKFDLPELLEFRLDSTHREAVKKAEENFRKLKSSHRVNVVQYNDYGNDLLKTNKLYADTIVQIAMQLAYLRTHGSFAPIYETASARKFFHGRTETVRGCTQEMVAFGKAVMEGERLNIVAPLLRGAYDAHNQLMNDCMDGEGFDRHLLGIRNCLAQFSKGCSPKQATPRFFNDPIWKRTGGDGNFLLSTSFTGYMLENEVGGYGYVCAMRADGYGSFYKIGKNRFLLVTTDWKGTASNLSAYGDNLTWAFDQIGTLLRHASKQ